MTLNYITFIIFHNSLTNIIDIRHNVKLPAVSLLFGGIKNVSLSSLQMDCQTNIHCVFACQLNS